MGFNPASFHFKTVPVRLTVVLLAVIAMTVPGGHAGTVPEPDGYRMHAYRAEVPATLAGARVIDTAEAEALWRANTAVFIDVLPSPPRPANLPEGTVWRPRKRDSIPGGHWLANVGFGKLNPAMDAYFRDHLTGLSKANLAAPLVFFCLENCWMSWNAAKRALTYGYTAVFWYPQGTDGWSRAGLPLQRVKPVE